MRGKHAAIAVARRDQVLQEHIDRLTDQVAEAKARARMVEREAAAAPGLRATVIRLEETLRQSERVELLAECEVAKAEAAQARQDYTDLAEIVLTGLMTEGLVFRQGEEHAECMASVFAVLGPERIERFREAADANNSRVQRRYTGHATKGRLLAESKVQHAVERKGALRPRSQRGSK